jgi:hypothetical protein
MNYLSALFILLASSCFFASCDQASEQKNDNPEKKEQEIVEKEESETNPLEYPFGEDLKSMGKATKYIKKSEEGDCWGSYTYYQLKESELYIDSTQCSEYYNQVEYFYSKNGKLAFYQIIKAEVNAAENPPTTYLLKESITNLEKGMSWTRSADVENLDLVINAEFKETELEERNVGEIQSQFKAVQEGLKTD